MHLINWDEWRGSLDGRPIMWIKNLLSFRGYKLDLHKFVGADDSQCFHTHPARALRVILWGGYIEELENGTNRKWFPLRFGIVTPSLSHRISKLLYARSYSIWFRWPKTAKIKLNGSGWNRSSQNK